MVAPHCAEVGETTCAGSARAPARALRVLAGAARAPCVTTHVEAGVRVVVDLDSTFFSPRLALERMRVCKCVARGERVLVLFAGCGPEALHVASRTEASLVVGVEMNEIAAKCFARGLETLARAKKDNANRVRVVHADALQDLQRRATLGERFDRVLAPRPKSRHDGERAGADDERAAAENAAGTMTQRRQSDDHDDHDTEARAADDAGGGGGADGEHFLHALLPLLAPGGEVHWTDFAADWELPRCERTRAFLNAACAKRGLHCEVLHSGRAGSSVAKRQYRVTVDFRVSPII